MSTCTKPRLLHADSPPEALPSPRAVPEYTVHDLRPRSTRYAVCVFVINEGQRIRRQLERMQAVQPAAGHRAGRRRQHRRLHRSGVTDGAGRACLAGQARPRQAQRADAHGLGLVPGARLRRRRRDGRQQQGRSPGSAPIRRDAGTKAGTTCRARGSCPAERPSTRPGCGFWAIKLLHAPLISLASGFRYTDTTNGFRAYSRRLAGGSSRRSLPRRLLDVRAALLPGDPRGPARLSRRRDSGVAASILPAADVPTKIHGWRGNALILRTLWSACRGKFNPPLVSS